MWPLGLVDSAWHGSQYDGKAGLERAAAIGFDAVDLFCGFDPGDLTADERRRRRTDADEAGLTVNSLICTALGLTDFNPSVARYAVERAKRVTDLAAEIATPTNILLVPGEYMFQRRLLPPEQEWGRLVAAVREVAERAATHDLDVAIELLPFEHAFIRSLDDMLRLFDDVGMPNVTAAVDISHLWLERIAPSEIARLDGRIAQIHISDCDGENHGDLPPGRGNTPFLEYLRALEDAGYQGTVSLELEFPTDPGAMLDWVAEAYEATSALLVEIGKRA